MIHVQVVLVIQSYTDSLLTVILSNASVVSSIPLVWEGVLLPGLEYDCSPPIPPYRVGLLSRLEEIQQKYLQHKLEYLFKENIQKAINRKDELLFPLKVLVM